MYGDYIHEVTPDGKVVWEWHACRDMEVEKYPLSPSQLRDEFAHANAISPLPDGDILHQLPPTQHDRAHRSPRRAR